MNPFPVLNLRRILALPACVFGVALLCPDPATAQLAPTGAHYAGRPSDTGYDPGGVSAFGGYAASLPLALPAPRGGLPLPLDIRYGAKGVGAAGLGWDVPLSYVRRTTSIAHRRPASARTLQGREQVTVSLLGQTLDMVRRGQEWVPRRDAPDLVLRQQGDGTWLLTDGQARTWRFTRLAVPGLWLLASIRSAGNASRVDLDYEVTQQTFPGGTGVSMDLAWIRYNHHPTEGCPKNEISLRYGAVSTAPLSLTLLDDVVLVRRRVLVTVGVTALPTCTGVAERFRIYELVYLEDPDTRQLRLRSLRVRGRPGTPEYDVPLTLVQYGYGSATRQGKVYYVRGADIAPP